MASKKITNMEVKRKNRNRIYRYVRKSGIVSNPDIAYELKLSLPTVTQNTKELIELGLIKENGELESTGGRKAKALAIEADFRLAAGVDITKNHIGLILTNLAGEILRYERIYYPFCRSEEYFSEVSQKLEKFLKKEKIAAERILGVGISIPGITDMEKREITNSHVLNIKALSFQEMEKFFAYPCIFLNDANAGANAEAFQGEKEKNFFYLSLSNTVGGAYFSNGGIVYGSEFRCGEVGHMTIVPDGLECYCGKRGCFDSYCTAKKLAEFAGGKLETFFEGLKQKRPEYIEEWERYTKYLSIAVNNIHMLLDCDIVLGGYVGSYLEDYMADIRNKVSERNTFSEEGQFVKNCNYKIGAAALGAALYVIELFVEEI